MSAPLEKGDYVLATKYADGDPFDGWAVGFFDGMLPKSGGDRFMVVGANGHQFRGNGFRRCERISDELGEWIVHNGLKIDALTQVKPINIWRYKYGGEAARKALEGNDLTGAIERVIKAGWKEHPNTFIA